MVRFEVLSEEPLEYDSLSDLKYATHQGDCSGRFLADKRTTLNGKQCAKALLAQGSEPQFFAIDEEGNDLE